MGGEEAPLHGDGLVLQEQAEQPAQPVLLAQLVLQVQTALVELLELMVILALVTQSQMVHPAEEVLNT